MTMQNSINERSGRHGRNGAGKPDEADESHLVASPARDLLNLRRLPAMLTAGQVAVLLNRGEHDIPVLVRAGLIKPLGEPAPNAVKFFATMEILDLAENRACLDRICTALTQYWRERNEARGREVVNKVGGKRPPARIE